MGTVKSDDKSMRSDDPLCIYVNLLGDAMSKIGRPFPVAGVLKKKLEDAGFVDVKERQFKQPFGPWPRDKNLKQIGAMALVMV